jgi:hypothetical protein
LKGRVLAVPPLYAEQFLQQTPVRATKTFITKSISRPGDTAHLSARHNALTGVSMFAVAWPVWRADVRPRVRTCPRCGCEIHRAARKLAETSDTGVRA